MARAIIFLFSVLFVWLLFLVPSVHFINSMTSGEISPSQIDLIEKITGLISVFIIAIVVHLNSGESITSILGLRKASMRHVLFYIAPVIYLFLSIFLLNANMGARLNSAADFPWYEIGVIIFLTPLVEELLFRGGMFSDANGSNVQKIIVLSLSSIGFILIHPHWGLSTVIIMTPVAVYLGILRIKTGSVIPSILSHAMINTSLIIYALLMQG